MMPKPNIYERVQSNLIKNFVLDYFQYNSSDDLQLDQQDVNISLEIFIDNMK